MSSGLETIDQIKATFIDLAIRFGPKLATALVIFTAGVFIANGARVRARAVCAASSSSRRSRCC
jgi:hypothetical protein